jgi:hypothetical protein
MNKAASALPYKLANQGTDTRLIHDYLGHKNIQHTRGVTPRGTPTDSTTFGPGNMRSSSHFYRLDAC